MRDHPGPFGERQSVPGTAAFGALLRDAMRAEKLSQTGLAGYLTKQLPEGRYWDASGIRLLLKGQRRVDEDVFVLLLDRLPALDRGLAYEALGVWPPDLTVGAYRRATEGDGGGRRRPRVRLADAEAADAAGQPASSSSWSTIPPAQDAGSAASLLVA